MEGSDEGFASTQKKGGRKNPKQKVHKETILVTQQQAVENKKQKKKQTTFMYGNIVGESEQNEEEKKVEPKPQDVDEEPEEKQKKKKHQGKRGKKGKQQDEDEEEEEKQPSEQKQEEQQQTQEAVVEEIKEQDGSKSKYPLEVVYCKICDCPPEYCQNNKKDFSECKEWLKNSHLTLYEKIYGEEEKKENESTEESKGEAPKQQQKKKKKVGFGTENQEIKIYKNKRGAKKTICSVVGLQHYGVNLKDIAKIMSKKFACSAAVTTEDKYGECIQIQGDIEDRFDEFLASDLAKYNIPANKVKFEEVKKKKAAAPTEDDE